MDWYSDARTHTAGPSKYIRLPRVAPPGGGAIAISEDGRRSVVAGKECAYYLFFFSDGE